MTSVYDDGAHEPDHPETRDERDRRIERRYNFDRGEDGDLTLLAVVARDQVAMAHEFMAWWRGARFDGENWTFGLPRWEERRFGAQLEAAAHGVLRFAVRRMLAPVQQKPVPDPKRPQLGKAEQQRRFDEAVGKAARAKVWPRTTPEEMEARLEKLNQQANEVRGQ